MRHAHQARTDRTAVSRVATVCWDVPVTQFQEHAQMTAHPATLATRARGSVVLEPLDPDVALPVVTASMEDSVILLQENAQMAALPATLATRARRSVVLDPSDPDVAPSVATASMGDAVTS